MNIIKKYKLNYFVVYILLFFTSCKPSYSVIEQSYGEKREIKVPFYVFVNCEYIDLWRGHECNTNLVDSILPIFNESFDVYGFKINDSVKNKKVEILGKKFNGYYNHNKIDTIAIKENIVNKDVLNFIPVICFVDDYDRTYGGTNYKVHILLSVYLFDKNRFSYINSTGKFSKRFFYIDKDELDKSKIDTKQLIQELVDEALEPYLKRLQ